MLCLDTNVVIAFFNGRSTSVAARFAAAVRREIPLFLPIIAVFELRHGAESSQRREANHQRIGAFVRSRVSVLPFEDADSMHAADIYARLKTLGQPIGHYDVLIAAQARARGLTLITANVREFERVPDLALDDWTR